MSVIFISPKKRQKMFFLGITVAFLVFIFFVSLAVFLAKPTEVSPVLVFNKPKVNFDLSIFDSDEFKNLKSYTGMETQYSYKAVAKDKTIKTGFISATSEEEARTTLTNMDLIVSEVEEVQVGRDNPFTPYYSTAVEQTATEATGGD